MSRLNEYLVAAKNNPFVASWIAVLDAYQMPSFAELTPGDWWESFQDFWHEGFVGDATMMSLNVDKEFWKKTPPRKEIYEAHAALDKMRKEGQMVNFDVFDKPTAIARPQRSVVRSTSFDELDRLAPREEHAALSSVFEEKPRTMEPFRTFEGLAPRSSTPEIVAFDQPRENGRISSPIARREHNALDPRNYTDFKPTITCCGSVLELHFDDSRDVSGEIGSKEDGELKMIEYVFHTQCPVCDCEGHHSFVKPVPASILAGHGI